jgi:hypothetical protein
MRRRVCGAPSEKDAEWEEADFAAAVSGRGLVVGGKVGGGRGGGTGGGAGSHK